MSDKAKKVPKAPKTTTVSIRVTPEQRQVMEEAAIAGGASLSAYIASVAEKAARGGATTVAALPEPTAAANEPAQLIAFPPDALAELKKVGANINQLAHAANAQMPVDLRLAVESFCELFAVLSDLDAFKDKLAALHPHLPKPFTEEPQRPPVRQPQTMAPLATPTPKPAPPVTAPIAQPAEKVLRSPIRRVSANWDVDDVPDQETFHPHQSRQAESAVRHPREARLQPRRPDAPLPGQMYFPWGGSQEHAGAAAPPPLQSTPPRSQPAPRPLPDQWTPVQQPRLPPDPRPMRPSPSILIRKQGPEHDPSHPQTRHELQDGDRLHHARPDDDDERPGFFGRLGKLWRG